jgi:hypothetical protein
LSGSKPLFAFLAQRAFDRGGGIVAGEREQRSSKSLNLASEEYLVIN